MRGRNVGCMLCTGMFIGTGIPIGPWNECVHGMGNNWTSLLWCWRLLIILMKRHMPLSVRVCCVLGNGLRGEIDDWAVYSNIVVWAMERWWRFGGWDHHHCLMYHIIFCYFIVVFFWQIVFCICFWVEEFGAEGDHVAWTNCFFFFDSTKRNTVITGIYSWWANENIYGFFSHH